MAVDPLDEGPLVIAPGFRRGERDLLAMMGFDHRLVDLLRSAVWARYGTAQKTMEGVGWNVTQAHSGWRGASTGMDGATAG